MTQSPTTAATFSGPFEYLVFTFPDGSQPGDGLDRLLSKVDRGIVEILDLECIRLGSDGTGVTVPLTEVAPETPDSLRDFEGVESGILNQEDLDTIANTLAPGTFALALVYVSHALDPLTAAWERAGGQVVLAGAIDPEELESALQPTNIQE